METIKQLCDAAFFLQGAIFFIVFYTIKKEMSNCKYDKLRFDMISVWILLIYLLSRFLFMEKVDYFVLSTTLFPLVLIGSAYMISTRKIK
ncbi:MAG: hypothetical protein C0622_08035 [Desulfuromonas sp.]|nr:MAG: hypothetical protein C0622_08035 [Desulfuromonas sp.]